MISPGKCTVHVLAKNKQSILLDIFIPLTIEGNIMVGRVLASWYPSADHHFGPFCNDINTIVFLSLRMYVW